MLQFNVCVLYGPQRWQIQMILQTCILSVPQWNKSVLPLIMKLKYVCVCVCVCVEEEYTITYFSWVHEIKCI
jgi:hypothetical protein